MFTIADIQTRLHERPFVPVRIVTSSGQSYDVKHPDLVWTGINFLIIGKPSNDNPTIVEGASRVALLHIVDLQDIPNPEPTGTNGPTA
jgi:hypothetical protein